MRVVALLAVRNEQHYLERCLSYLEDQGIETCLIDNQSTDDTLEIARSFRHRGVFRIEQLPFTGIFEWTGILHYKSQLAREIDADWFIHHDADEIRQAPKPFGSLVEALRDVDVRGFNAVNSDEFVFVPTSEEEAYEGRDYVREMRYYYHFLPKPMHRVNIWKKTAGQVDLASTGGHSVMFADRSIYPRNFILRHYILLSRQHALEKYGKRIYDPRELARGMNVKRAKAKPHAIKFPDKSELKVVSRDGEWDRSDAWTRHFFDEP